MFCLDIEENITPICSSLSKLILSIPEPLEHPKFRVERQICEFLIDRCGLSVGTDILVYLSQTLNGHPWRKNIENFVEQNLERRDTFVKEIAA